MVTSCASDDKALARRHTQRGDAYVADGKATSAIIEYRLAIQLDPLLGEPRKKLGRLYSDAGDLTRALYEYTRAADLLPDDLEVQLTAGQLLLRAALFEDARTRAERVLQ